MRRQRICDELHKRADYTEQKDSSKISEEVLVVHAEAG